MQKFLDYLGSPRKRRRATSTVEEEEEQVAARPPPTRREERDEAVLQGANLSKLLDDEVDHDDVAREGRRERQDRESASNQDAAAPSSFTASPATAASTSSTSTATKVAAAAETLQRTMSTVTSRREAEDDDEDGRAELLSLPAWKSTLTRLDALLHSRFSSSAPAAAPPPPLASISSATTATSSSATDTQAEAGACPPLYLTYAPGGSDALLHDVLLSLLSRAAARSRVRSSRQRRQQGRAREPLASAGTTATTAAAIDSTSSLEQPTIQDLLPRYVLVDCGAVHSTRALFDAIVHSLAAWDERERAHTPRRWDPTVDHADRGARTRLERVLVRRRSPRVARETSKSSDEERPAKRARFDDGSHAELDDEQAEGEWALRWVPSSRHARIAPDGGGGGGGALTPDDGSLDGFLWRLRQLFNLGGDRGGGGGTEDASSSSDTRRTRTIVLAHAEHLYDLVPAAHALDARAGSRETGLAHTLVAALMRLDQLTRLPLRTVLLGKLPWDKMRHSLVGTREPLAQIAFPPLGRQDVVNVVAQRFARANALEPDDELVQVVRQLATHAFEVFAPFVSGDMLGELARVVAKFAPTVRALLENGTLSTNRAQRLGAHLIKAFTPDLQAWGEPRVKLVIPEHHLAAPPLEDDDRAPPPARRAAAPPHPRQTASIDPFLAAMAGSSSSAAAASSASQSALLSAVPSAYADDDDFVARAQAGSEAARREAEQARHVLSLTDAPGDAPSTMDEPIATTASPSALGSVSSAEAAAMALSGEALVRSLPTLTRYVLFAAYCASFNDERADAPLFVRRDDDGILDTPSSRRDDEEAGEMDRAPGAQRKEKQAMIKGRNAKKGGKASSPRKKQTVPKRRPGQSLRGPRAFALERLLALVEALLPPDLASLVSETDDILAQVARLAEVRVLERVAPADRDKSLDLYTGSHGVKLRCVVDGETAESLARSLKLTDWRAFLQPEAD